MRSTICGSMYDIEIPEESQLFDAYRKNIKKFVGAINIYKAKCTQLEEENQILKEQIERMTGSPFDNQR